MKTHTTRLPFASVSTAAAVIAILLSLGEATQSAFSQKKAASSWVFIGVTPQNARLYYSPSRTLRQRTGLIRGWFKVVLPESNTETDQMVGLSQVNCPQGRMRILQNTIYFRDGRTRFEGQPTEWEYPTPESLSELVFKRMCRPAKRE